MKITIEVGSLDELKTLLDQLLHLPLSGIEDRHVKTLPLSVRTQNCLLAEGVDTLHKLLRLSKYDLLRLPNLGPKSATEIAEVLGLLMPAPQPTTPP